MEKLFVYFKADDQDLVCCNPFRVSSKKVAYVEAHFDLGENWTGYDSVRAIWRNTQNFAIIGTVLDSQGICKVPTEVLTSIGQVDVNLVGSISENNVLTDRLTTYPVEAGRVDANALVDGSETAEITPSQFEQFAAAVRNDAERAREGAEAAESYADAAAGSAEAAAGSAQSAADDAQRIAQMIQDVIEQIEDFYGVTVSVETLPAGSQATARYEEGHLYLGIPKGDKGDTGNGIASIAKTGTSGLVDTYTITFTNGQTTTFAVTNGEKGDTGNGIASITKTGTSGLVDTYTITYTDGQTETFTVTNGEKGDTGNGIDRIELTSTSGYVKTYTIYFTDGSSTTFEVTDGEVSFEDYYKLFIEDTASGSIASFPDGADDIPMISVLADIDPIQDLHGYDKPWAEGANVNLFDGEIEQGGISASDGTNYNTTTSTRSKNYVSVIPSQTYFYQKDASNYGFYIYTYGSDKTFKRFIDGRGIGTSFTPNSDEYYLRFRWNTGTVADIEALHPMVSKGSTRQSSWTPYSNECPISGHTECVTDVCGKNLADPSKFSIEKPSWSTQEYWLGLTANSDGTFTETRPIGWGGNGLVYVGTFKAGTYYVSADVKDLAGVTCALIVGSKKTHTWDNTAQPYVKSDITALGRYGTSVTISETSDIWVVVGPYANNGNQVKFGDIQVELSSTATAYEPYNGTTHTTSLGRTVYGGEVEVVGGSLTDKMGMVDLGTLNWIYMSSQGVFYSSEEVNAKATACLSNIYEYSSVSVGSGRADSTINVGLAYFGVNKVSIKDSRYTDASALKQMLIDNNAVLCYELAQPQTYQLSPQQINSLLGTNNVWADTGDVEVKYRANTKLYIDKVLAP